MPSGPVERRRHAVRAKVRAAPHADSTARRYAAARVLLLVVVLCRHRAQPTAEPTPEQVRSLLQLLSDPVVKTWIAREMRAPAASCPRPVARLDAVEAQPAAFVEAGLTALKARSRRSRRRCPDVPHGAGRSAKCARARRTRGYRLAPGAAPARRLPRPRLWLRAALLACRRRVPGADTASPLDTPAARTQAVLARSCTALPGCLPSRWAASAHFCCYLAARACGPWCWAICWPSCARAGWSWRVSVLAAVSALPRRADERRGGSALVSLDRRLHRLVRVRLRHHPAAASLRPRRAGVRSWPICWDLPAGDRLAPVLALGSTTRRTHRRHGRAVLIYLPGWSARKPVHLDADHGGGAAHASCAQPRAVKHCSGRPPPDSTIAGTGVRPRRWSWTGRCGRADLRRHLGSWHGAGGRLWRARRPRHPAPACARRAARGRHPAGRRPALEARQHLDRPQGRARGRRRAHDPEAGLGAATGRSAAARPGTHAAAGAAYQC